MKKVEMLQLPNGKTPFEEWFKKLSFEEEVRIDNYVKRLAAGGAKKNIRALGDSVFEIKINYGPGFRVYFGEIDSTIILLLLGGNKSTQKRDIKKAKEYWRSYNV